jgi:hypothetical protein
VIARTSDGGKTFRGVYHHWDSYPAGLGKTLFHLLRKDPEKLRLLIDEHPKGWSTINKDWDLEPIDTRRENKPTPCGPEFYGKGDTEFECTERNATESGCEYAYAFEDRTMYVLSSYREDGDKMIGMFGMGDPRHCKGRSRWS